MKVLKLVVYLFIIIRFIIYHSSSCHNSIENNTNYLLLITWCHKLTITVYSTQIYCGSFLSFIQLLLYLQEALDFDVQPHLYEQSNLHAVIYIVEICVWVYSFTNLQESIKVAVCVHGQQCKELKHTFQKNRKQLDNENRHKMKKI